ncbi:MAG TPA: tetratricopeptide repeat protein [Nitrospirota bacterium]|nr:tetratricopeptide repeat protein [Nitrospirota bacterium]
MDKDTSEIAKLTERISKDPKSKLFVPLAEEYKKSGDLEMSIHVLTEGLKNNPGYVTARSFLGKLLFEKGDLAGAQKEFEEVVKAIPDNLMAQRKLGDLYILQNRPTDALMHYKTVLSLNQKDQETASLVSDVEAGRDVKTRIAGPKPLTQEKAAKKQEPPQAVAPPADTKPQPSPARGAPTGPLPAPPMVAKDKDIEEPEEVLIVEPLEAAGSTSLEDALSSKGLDFLSESVQEPALTDSGEERREEDPFAVQQAAKGSHAVEETSLEASEGETPAALAEEPDKQADDFTTDTLAELYITQGFFEKAIDIYERMLLDNPNSQGLKNKLANVRAMAAETAPAAEPEAEAWPLAVPEDLATMPAPTEIPAADTAPGFFDDEYVPPSQEIEPSQSTDQRSSPAPSPEREEKRSLSGPASAQPKQFDAGFEPVEYVPPSGAPQGAEETFGKTADEKLTAEKTGMDIVRPRKSLVTGRKETIDRLENWLQHIMKEK